MTTLPHNDAGPVDGRTAPANGRTSPTSGRTTRRAPHRTPRRGRRAAPAAECGLGLIEILIALVIVSFGVLGMAGLQLTGMKHSAGGLERSKALLFAGNAAARMRINEPGVAAGRYDAFDTATWGNSCAARPDPYCQASVGSDGSVSAAERCDTGQLADFDLWSLACGDWGADAGGTALGEGVIDALPGGRLQIGCDASPCTTYTVTVQWNENDDRAAPDATVVTRRVQLRLRP